MQAHSFRLARHAQIEQPLPTCIYCHHRRDVIEMRGDNHPTRIACPVANRQHFCGAPCPGDFLIDGEVVHVGGCELPAGHWSDDDISARHSTLGRDGRGGSSWGASRACREAAAGIVRPSKERAA